LAAKIQYFAQTGIYCMFNIF